LGEEAQLPGQSPIRNTGPFLVVGLGNPGMEYLWTPHNAGFMAIDRIAQQHGVVVQNRRCKAQTATVRIGGIEAVLAKPETFMNLSGLSVAALVKELGDGQSREKNSPVQNLVVIYDELDLPLGRIKIGERGSAAGHNGARSIIGSLGTQEWLRIRIGVGPNLPPEAIAAGAQRRGGKDYLLEPMRKADLAVLDEVLDRVATAVRKIVEDEGQWSGVRDQGSEKILERSFRRSERTSSVTEAKGREQHKVRSR
jgi:PTH1 family peptidyl-tRNA hydrolase